MKLWQCKNCKLMWESKNVQLFTKCPSCKEDSIFHGDVDFKRAK